MLRVHPRSSEVVPPETAWRRWCGKLYRVSPAYYFLLLTVPFGLFLVFVLPPGQGLDEINHFYRAYTISEGSFVAVHHDGRVGGYVPTCVSAYITRISHEAVNPPVRLADMMTSDSCKPASLHFDPFENTAYESPVPYLPQAAAIWVGRMANLPVFAIFYMGRIAALLIYVALVFVAIRVAPVGRVILALIGAWPMAVIEAAIYSADTITTAIAVLFVALILRARQQSSWPLLMFTGLASLVLALSKDTYVILTPLMWLLPTPKEVDKALYGYAKATAITLAIGISGAWVWQVKDISETAWFPPGMINAGRQITDIKNHPLWYVTFIVRCLLEDPTASWFTWRSFVAQVGFFPNPSRGTTVAPVWAMITGYMVLILAYVRAFGECVSWSMRGVLLAAVPTLVTLINVVLIFTAVYVESTAFRTAPIMAGRYLLPLVAVPLLSLALLSRCWDEKPVVMTYAPWIVAIYVWVVMRAIGLYY